MLIKTTSDVQTRCFHLCGLSKPCFTSDQVQCICDIVINKICTIKTIIENAQLLCNDLSDMNDYLALAHSSIDELITWCRSIEKNKISS